MGLSTILYVVGFGQGSGGIYVALAGSDVGILLMMSGFVLLTLGAAVDKD